MISQNIISHKKIKFGKKLHFRITLKPVCDNIPTNTSGMSSPVRLTRGSLELLSKIVPGAGVGEPKYQKELKGKHVKEPVVNTQYSF